jgi:hypothetical protein
MYCKAWATSRRKANRYVSDWWDAAAPDCAKAYPGHEIRVGWMTPFSSTTVIDGWVKRQLRAPIHPRMQTVARMQSGERFRL